MKKIIVETEKLAYIFLSEFGFEEKEIAPIVAKGLFDLEKNLEKLDALLSTDHEVKENELDDVLHALKGLFFQLGNHDVAEKIEIIRSRKEFKNQYDDLKKLLV